MQDQPILNANYVIPFISLIILYYDYFLTLTTEIEGFWNYRLTWASFVFFLNRYLALLGHIPVIVIFFFNDSNLVKKTQICQSFRSYHELLSALIQIVVAVLLIIRTYALYDRSRRILGFTCGSAIVVVAFGCWAVITPSHRPVPQPNLGNMGCNPSVSKEDGVRFAAIWSSLLLFDIVIFTLTVYRTVTISGRGLFRGEMGWRWGLGRGLVGILLRDGAIYFVVMGMAYASTILTCVVGGEQIYGIATMLTNVISTTAISRLMLNLRDPKHFSPPSSTMDSSNPVVSTLTEVTEPWAHSTTDSSLAVTPMSNEGITV